MVRAVFRDDAVRWPWEVNVLTVNEVNAWCMPSGKMAVYTGLLQQLEITNAGTGQAAAVTSPRPGTAWRRAAAATCSGMAR